MQSNTYRCLVLLILLFCIPFTHAQTWQETINKAKGDEVYFNAWGGSPTINTYIDWVAQQVKEQYDITLHHVKINDTALAVKKVIAENTGGRVDDGGSVDLIWINGENFKTLKENKYLFGPYTQLLPNFAFVDIETKPTTIIDFGVPTDGYESPWGMSQFVMLYDSAKIPNPPKNISALLAYAKQHPQQVTYPLIPNYIGTTFLKQVLYATISEPNTLLQPVNSKTLTADTAQLFEYIDTLHRYSWQEGKSFPSDGEDQARLLNDGEISISFAFNPAEASTKIQEGTLPKSIRTAVFENGTIGNTHFVAIPNNARAKEAALVVANFLLSPQAQYRKQNSEYWGDFTVLDMKRLNKNWQNKFNNLPRGVATLSPEELGKVLPEPHSSWVDTIEKLWSKKYQ